MKIVVFDTYRPWVINNLPKSFDVLEYSEGINLNGVNIVLVHHGNMTETYTLNDNETWKDVYCDIFKPTSQRKVIVYSGGEIESLNSSANLIIVPWRIPHEEISCPTRFKEYLMSLDEKLLVIKQENHLIALSILCQGYLAAHGLLDSLKGKGIEIDSDKVKLTESPDWWKPALGDDNGAELKKELLISGKNDEEANKLIQDIKANNIETVYETLRGILARKS